MSKEGNKTGYKTYYFRYIGYDGNSYCGEHYGLNLGGAQANYIKDNPGKVNYFLDGVEIRDHRQGEEMFNKHGIFKKAKLFVTSLRKD